MGGGGTVRPGQATFKRSLVYGFSAAASFSMTDVLAQKWAPAWGFTRFAPMMFLTVGVLSLGLIPHFRGSLWELPARTWRWLLPGSVLLGIQAGGVAVSIMTFGQATHGEYPLLLARASGRCCWSGSRATGLAMRSARTGTG